MTDSSAYVVAGMMTVCIWRDGPDTRTAGRNRAAFESTIACRSNDLAIKPKKTDCRISTNDDLDDDFPNRVDSCPTTPNRNPADQNGDGVGDVCDNGLLARSADPRDTNIDGFGPICDPDFDNNLLVNAADLSFFELWFFGTHPEADLNGDGFVNAADLAILKRFFFQPPGPSGPVPQWHRSG